MKKANVAMSFNTPLNRIPSADQLYALERLAREERARALAAAFTRGLASVRLLYARTVAVLASKVVRHA